MSSELPSRFCIGGFQEAGFQDFSLEITFVVASLTMVSLTLVATSSLHCSSAWQAIRMARGRHFLHYLLHYLLHYYCIVQARDFNLCGCSKLRHCHGGIQQDHGDCSGLIHCRIQ